MNKESFKTQIQHGLIEMVAVFGFVFFGLGSVVLTKFYSTTDGAVNTAIIALTHGVYIGVAIASFSKLSGAHINPAISFAMWIMGVINAQKFIIYLLMQLAGALIGAFVWKFIFSEPVGVHTLSVAPFSTSILEGLLLEILCTFFLSAVIFSCLNNKSHLMTSLAIGATIFLGSLVAIPFTGGSMNPARSFGPAIIFGELQDHWIYWIAPLIGAPLGAVAGLWCKGELKDNIRFRGLKK